MLDVPHVLVCNTDFRVGRPVDKAQLAQHHLFKILGSEEEKRNAMRDDANNK